MFYLLKIEEWGNMSKKQDYEKWSSGFEKRTKLHL